MPPGLELQQSSLHLLTPTQYVTWLLIRDQNLRMPTTCLQLSPVLPLQYCVTWGQCLNLSELPLCSNPAKLPGDDGIGLSLDHWPRQKQSTVCSTLSHLAC